MTEFIFLPERRPDREIVERFAQLLLTVEELRQQRQYLWAIQKDNETELRAIAEDLVDRLLPAGVAMDILKVGQTRLLLSRKDGVKEAQII